MVSNRLLILVVFVTSVLAPNPVVRAQWIQTNGPGGGNITALTVNGNSIFAASDGIFRSDNHGRSWVLVDTVTGISNLATGNSAVFALSNASLLRSTDDGGTWDSLHLRNIQALSVKEISLLAGFSDSIRYSSDNGSTWRSFPRPHGKSSSINLVAILNNELVVSFLDQYDPYPPHELISTGGVYATSDFGSTWDSIYPKPFSSVDQSGGNIFAVASGELLESKGTGWQQLTSLPSQLTITGIASVSSDLYAVAYGIGLYRSTDNGSNWELTDLALKGRDVHAVAADGGAILAATDDGLYRSTDDGLTWIELGITGASTQSLITVGNNLFASDGDGFFLSTDDGGSWSFRHTSLGDWSSEMLSIGSIIIRSTNYGLVRSSDSGITWSTATDKFSWGHFAISNNVVYAGYAQELFASSDSGLTWSVVDSTTLDGVWSGALAANRSIIFMGAQTSIPGGMQSGDIWRSTNGGVSWTRASGNGLGVYWGGPFRLFTSGNYLFAADDFSLYRSIDSGENWTRVQDNISLNAFASSGGNIFIGRSNGVFLSTDGGSHWINVSSGLRNGVESLCLSGNYLFAGTQGGGVWRMLISDVVPAVGSATPSLIAYPNPFSSTTTIRYVLSSITEATVTIYDALGRAVATLLSAEQAPGAYEINFQPDGLEPGTYWCRLSTSDGSRALPMIIEPK